MIVRDSLRVSECGIHMRGPGGLGSGPRCPACLRMLELARTEGVERKTISGRDAPRPVGRSPWRMGHHAAPPRYVLTMPGGPR